jgi:hypothetical protein
MKFALLLSIVLIWEMRSGSTYFLWWKEQVDDQWQPIASSTMAGTSRFTNRVAVILSSNPRKGWVGTNILALEVTNTPTRFFMITTNENGSGSIPVAVKPVN